MLSSKTHKFYVRQLAVLLCTSIAACSSEPDARPDARPDTLPGDETADAPTEVEPTKLDATTSIAPPRRVPDGGVSIGDAASADATSAAEGGHGDVDAGPSIAAACDLSTSKARCTAEEILTVGASNDLRKVYYARPTTPEPSAGYPAVFLYQGSFFGPSTTWNVDVPQTQAFGGYYQVKVVAELLAAGFVVVQPEAQDERFWTTNVAVDFASSADGVFIPLLLTELSKGTFGHVDTARLYATGMSSGGYMTSRMAVSFAGRFRALAIHSAAYATCAGPSCAIPAKLPVDHPPTLFLHGGADTIVPIYTAEAYETKLKNAGFETAFERAPAAGHEWIPVAPAAITKWFMEH